MPHTIKKRNGRREAVDQEAVMAGVTEHKWVSVVNERGIRGGMPKRQQRRQ
jgi:hypothetical protein